MMRARFEAKALRSLSARLNWARGVHGGQLGCMFWVVVVIVFWSASAWGQYGLYDEFNDGAVWSCWNGSVGGGAGVSYVNKAGSPGTPGHSYENFFVTVTAENPLNSDGGGEGYGTWVSFNPSTSAMAPESAQSALDGVSVWYDMGPADAALKPVNESGTVVVNGYVPQLALLEMESNSGSIAGLMSSSDLFGSSG